MDSKELDTRLQMCKRILDCISEAVVAANNQNRVFHCNEVFYRMFGLSESECIGEPFPTIADKYFGTDLCEGVLYFNNNSLSSGVIKKEFVTFCKTKRGDRIPVDASITLIKGHSREHDVMSVTFRDISRCYINCDKLKSSEKNIEYLVEQLRDADRSKKDLVYTLSHEIRNPLASLTIGISLLEKHLFENGKTNSALESVKRQLASLTGMTEDMLDVARIEFKKYKINREVINIVKFISTIVQDFKPHTEKKEISLAANICSEQFEVFADSCSINRMMINLLNNALKFTHCGGSIKVELYRDYENNEAVITVSDTGIGFLPDKSDRLFEPFAQEKEQPTGNDGLGLGLAIVKGIVDLHGGTVEAASEGINKGSSFIVRIPISEREPEVEREIKNY